MSSPVPFHVPVCCRAPMLEVTSREQRSAGLSGWECEFCGWQIVTIQADPEVSDEPDPAQPAERTEAPPGSAEKVEVMCARHAQHLHLYHPGDNPAPARVPDAHTRGGNVDDLPAGVDWVGQRRRKCWRARLPGRGGRCLGYFATPEEAGEAVRAALAAARQ